MLFNSHAFIFIFFPAALTVFLLAARMGRSDWGKILALVASVVFYSWWYLPHLPILVGSIVGNFLAGLAVRRTGQKHRKAFIFGGGVLINLLLLGYFKYSFFFTENLSALLGRDLTIAKMALPIGISFYTFTQIAYLVDQFRGDSSRGS